VSGFARSGPAGEFDGEALGRLAADHKRLEAVVERLEKLLERADGEAAAKEFLVHLEYVHELCELLHFPLEDTLLEIVLESGLTPSERRVVFVNLAQHQQIYADAVGVLGRWNFDSGVPRAAMGDFQTRADTYVKGLRGHLEFEERHLQPLLRRRLTARETLRIDTIMHDLLGTLAGKPLERLAALDMASEALASG
jgi:hemerythrin-like domain-containing protein